MTLVLQASVEYVNINCEINQSEQGSSLLRFNLCLTQQIWEVKFNQV